MQLTPKQTKKLQKIKDLIEKGDVGLLQYLMELEDKIDEEIPQYKELISKLKGDKGEDGKNYELTDDDKKEISQTVRSLFDDDAFATKILNMIDIPIDRIAKEASKFIKVPEVKVNIKAIAKEASKLVEVENGKDGLDADEEKVILEVTKNIENNLPQFGTSFRDGLELLHGDERLDVSAVKGLDELIKEDSKGKYIVGGSRVLSQLLDTNILNPTNGQVLAYNGTSQWWENQNATGGITSVSTDSTLIGDGSIGSPLGFNLSIANTWTATQSFDGTIPVHFSSQSNWTTDDFNVARIASDFSGGPDVYLSLDWSPTYAGGLGALRFWDTGGNLKYLNANVYGDNAQFNNQLTAGSVSGNLYPSGGTPYYVYYGGAGGLVTGNAKFAFNDSTNRLLIANTGITAQSQLHLHQSGATAIETRFTNSSTGSTANDGFDIGIDSTGIAELRQRENTSIHVYVNNSLRTTWSAGGAGQLAHDGEFIETRNSIKTTDTYGVSAANQASATAGVPVQQPPMFTQMGHVWDTGASATRIIGFNIAQTYTSGNPGTGVLRFGYQYNASGSFSASGFNTLMNLSSSGRLSIGNGATVGNSTLDVTGSFQCDTITNDTGLAHGTYTPTLTGVNNIASSTAYACQYMRVGNTVTVSGQIEIVPTANNAQTTIGISLPISSNFTNEYELGGTGHSTANTTAGHGASMNADTINDRANLDYYETHGAGDTLAFSFTYLVK